MLLDMIQTQVQNKMKGHKSVYIMSCCTICFNVFINTELAMGRDVTPCI